MSIWKRHRTSARILMRSVSIFVASGRRVSSARRLSEKNVMDDGAITERKTDAPVSELLHPTVVKTPNNNVTSCTNSAVNLTGKLRKKTHFSKFEIDKLNIMFKKFIATSDTVSNNYSTPTSLLNKTQVKGMDRSTFCELLYSTFHIITEDILMDRIFSAFDRLNDGIIHWDEWILGLSIFLKGTPEEKIAFTFFVYDLNSDGFITKDEIFTLMRNSLLKMPQDEDADENVKDLSDIVLRKLDIDRDNKISFQDFRSAVLKDDLLSEALGQCLPTDETISEFLLTLNGKQK